MDCRCNSKGNIIIVPRMRSKFGGTMRQVSLGHDINIAVNGLFLVVVTNQEWVIYGNVDITF